MQRDSRKWAIIFFLHHLSFSPRAQHCRGSSYKHNCHMNELMLNIFLTLYGDDGVTGHRDKSPLVVIFPFEKHFFDAVGDDFLKKFKLFGKCQNLTVNFDSLGQTSNFDDIDSKYRCAVKHQTSNLNSDRYLVLRKTVTFFTFCLLTNGNFFFNLTIE